MADKVQKIREEVERLKSQLIKGACASQIAMETRCKEEAYNEVLSILDNMQEGPVSEELEEAAHEYADLRMSNYETAFYAFMSGAKWQKVKDQSTIELAEDHAMLAGMEKMKEEMMTKSIEAVVSQVPCSNEIILYNPSSVDRYYLPQEMNKLGLNKGDKIKLVIIKED